MCQWARGLTLARRSQIKSTSSASLPKGVSIILEAASSFSRLPNVVEKDYVLGWILAGIDAHEKLAESWVFNGGTCVKKCYFETYRFSEDLDFTLRNEEHLDEEFLRPVFEEVIAWVAEQSGLTIPADQLEFDVYTNDRGRPNCQGKTEHVLIFAAANNDGIRAKKG